MPRAKRPPPKRHPARSRSAADPLDTQALLEAWQSLSAEGLNNRAAAAQLGVAEAQLVASACGLFATRLQPDARSLFERAGRLGCIKLVVRNDWAVLERPGEIASIESHGAELKVAGSSFALQLGAQAAHAVYALRERGRGGPKRSLQFFDASGVSIVKLVLRPESDAPAFDRLVADFQSRDGPEPPPQQRWTADAVSRAGIPVPAGALGAFLHRAAALRSPLGLRVGNGTATLEVHAPIHRIKRSDRAPWINILDDSLDVHLFETQLVAVAIERFGEDAGSVHWVAPDGSVAFSATLSRGLEELAATALGMKTQ